MDWEANGAVNTPQNQGYCGSCWAHASVGSIEGIHKIRFGELCQFSVQEVIDCATRTQQLKDIFGRILGVQQVKGKGCQGGYPFNAFEYVKRWGIVAEKAYPLRCIMGHGKCQRDGKMMETTGLIDSYALNCSNERALMRAVSKQPVVVSLDTCPTVLLYTYKGGIIEIEDWPPSEAEPAKNMRHAVLLVGYGKDSNGNLYWKFKNSYGPRWGSKGFRYLRRGVADKRGVAGITRYISYSPIIFKGEGIPK